MSKQAETKALRRLTLGELHRLIWSQSLTESAKRLGMSPNGLAKICDDFGVERPPQGYFRRAPETRAPAPAFDRPDLDEVVIDRGERRQRRRGHARLSREERVPQILDVARQIVCDEGVHEVSIKRIARDMAMSEAQTHNLFSTRIDLLVALAQQELRVFEETRHQAIARGRDRTTKIVLSTTTYLREAARRGGVLQDLLSISEVQERLNDERESVRQRRIGGHVASIVKSEELSEQDAFMSVMVISAMCRTAGALVSAEKLSLDRAEQFCISIALNNRAGS